ncbi:Acriflavine sensitivity control protein acr-2 [Pleurostoma richardsiae]|uniref:Acriflavine sensitivity control protein acr-2 n=1 Tax=Pleurostoma richardsiae TaxID=41990 RepID=A0AA38RHV6_9PEZI|nr:Acriflavine sensitivity control protein acr-2 [Pleurostoma richardsiae]
MTVPLPTPSNPAKGDAAVAAAAVRKRRRRAPAGGAADDCFTCSKRNVKCDRRRPYCSQCLEVGNECSGYKTQLTWGVGVASRGKLRGLSLPIAKAPPVQPVKKSPTRSRANSSVAGAGQWHDRDVGSPRNGRDDVDIPREQPSSLPTTPFHGYDLSQISQGEPAPSVSSGSWGGIPFSTSLPDGHRFPKLGPHLGQTPEVLSTSIDSLSDADYMSPMSHSFPRDDLPFVTSPTIMYESFTGQNSPIPQSPVSAIMMDHQRAPTSCPSLVYAASDQGSSLHSHIDNFESQLSSKLLEVETLVGTPDMDAYSTSAQSNGHFWGPAADDDAASHGGVPEHHPPPWPSSLEPQQTLPVNPDLIAKMPFFMDYYENTMCPSMVFIDGPNNPFRDHILGLAAGSRSLQHAICALAACNLRMKRKLSLGHHGRDLAAAVEGSRLLDQAAELHISSSESQPEDQSLSEEYQHRNLAVHLLNEQLNDPASSRHDSVLATILLLCHYRMAESGIAKFHTQFAGVKKILGMRKAVASPYPPSRESAWMEAIFTYFDAISASINDREAQLNTSFYGVVPDAQLLPPGAENLVGCDRELFRTIIKLGRLNLLSQHRPVQSLHPGAGGGTGGAGNMPRHSPSRSQSPLGSPLGHAYNTRLDGNGFGTTLDDDELVASTLSSSSAGYDDHRSTFWREWKEARLALQSWEFDPARILAGLSSGGSSGSSAAIIGGGAPAVAAAAPASAQQVRDLGSLSEAFRYAALLYTERLASPAAPSAHGNFRNLVSQVVYYATSLEAGSPAEKFLLWPLFVAGSECVNELQQGIVRAKCREIMARSGYMNNLAALDVLERLWAGEGRDGAEAERRAGMVRRGPFKWTRCIGGPGVEVEWIMF